MKEFILLSELAKQSHTNPETVKNYVRKGLITAFVEGQGTGQFRRFKANEALRQINEIKELKRSGFSLEMIKKTFTPCKDKDCGHSQFDHEKTHLSQTHPLYTADDCTIGGCDCKKFK